MTDMLEGKQHLSLKRAVYVAENAYLNGKLDYENDFCKPIKKTSEYLYRLITANNWWHYKTAKQIALCNYFFYPCSGNEYNTFDYDFSCEYTSNDWHYQLVSRTLKKHKGQCRSLPWTFKLLAEEMGADVQIAHVPRHCILMYKDEDNLFPEDWVYVSLSSKQYQSSLWIKDFFAVEDSAIIAGTYLTPLTDIQMIASQLCDLAMVYVDRFHKYDNFSLKCAETSLKYYCMNPNAIIVKGKSAMALLEQYLKNNEYQKDAYTDKLEKLNKQCIAMLKATHWTQETPELRKRWTQDVSNRCQTKTHKK